MSTPPQALSEEVVQSPEEDFGTFVARNATDGPKTKTAHDQDLQRWHDEILRINQKKEGEIADRAARKMTPRYMELEQMMAAAKAEQDAMLADLLDSTFELEEAKRQMTYYLQQADLTKFGNIYAKIGKKSTVNVGRLLNVIGGDIGILLEMAKVSQTQLKDFADLQPHLKKELMSCVDSVGVVKDLEIGFANFSL